MFSASQPRFSFSAIDDDIVPEAVSSQCPDEESSQAEGEDLEDTAAENEHDPLTSPTTGKHYEPRTCRICLEVVLPTFEPPTEGIAATFNPSPKVSYQSDELGRLIRPCKCKGSSRYVHEGCLQQWRYAGQSRRAYFECPTCGFQYHLTRLKWSAWISSTFMQLLLTVLILFMAVFVLGFVADPIINLYLDPYDTIRGSVPLGRSSDFHYEDEEASWLEHFAKGLASLGLLGFVKAFFAMSPWHWWNLRTTGIVGGRRRGGTGRDRLANISWSLVLIGVATFLYATWRLVRSWCRRTLEKASDRVVDVQGNDDGEEADPTTPKAEDRKTQ